MSKTLEINLIKQEKKHCVIYEGGSLILIFYLNHNLFYVLHTRDTLDKTFKKGRAYVYQIIS